MDVAAFAARRARLLHTLAQHPLSQAAGSAAAVVFTAKAATRNSDVEHPYRADSTFWWLTGLIEPEAALVLLPGRPEGESVLFVRERDPEAERWTGRRLGTAGAKTRLGVDETLPFSALSQRLPELLMGRRALWADFGSDAAERDALLFAAAATTRARCRRQGSYPTAFLQLALLTDALRLKKDDVEVGLLRRAAALTTEGHRRAMAATRPGVTEGQLAALLHYVWQRGGSKRPGYEPIVAGGSAATILHYVENDQPLHDGQLVLIDAGCEVDHYTADVTRTYPVSGRFTPAQRDLYDVVLGAHAAALAAARPGSTLRAVDDAARSSLASGLVSLGLLSGSVESLVTRVPVPGAPVGHPGKAPLDAYYGHGTSHWLGLDVHDAGAYHDDGVPTTLAPGMVFTIEPGLYIDAADDKAPAALRGTGIRIEDDILVTADGVTVLTDDAPKDPAALEALIGTEPLW